MKCLLAVTMSLACFAMFAERQPLDRYQPIVDRQMFGQLPPGFDPTVPPENVPRGGGSGGDENLTKDQAVLKSSIHFSVINVTPDGETVVGFTDASNPKVPMHYYLKVGEERNGWKVVEADPLKATMKIAKDGIEVALVLGANSAKESGATNRSSAGGRAGLLGGRRAGALTSRSLGGGRGGESAPLVGGSLRERRALRELERQEEEKKEKELEAQRAAEREEQRKELQLLKEELKAQRDAAEKDRAEREAAERARAEREQSGTKQETAEEDKNAEVDI